MKTAKEWAESVVTEAQQRRPGVYSGWILDAEDCVALQGQAIHQEADAAVADARSIIERLVERVRADARAPLEELLFEVRDALRDIHRYAALGSLEENYGERLLPKIEEALR